MKNAYLITFVAILLAVQTMTASTACGDTILLQDNFDDNSMDASKWTTSGVQVQETGGIMRVLTDATDNGGVLISRPFTMASRGAITITRSVYLHHVNDYFCGHIAVRFGGLPWAAVYYADHSYTDTDWLQRFGIYLGKNSSDWEDAIARSNAANITGPYSDVLWDTWFDEKIVYSPDTGIMECYINSQKLGEQFIGIMPSTDSTMQLGFRAWGWYTGHYQNIDNVVVSQSTQPITPATIKVFAPTMGSTRAFLEWSDAGISDKTRYKVYVWQRTKLLDLSIYAWSSWKEDRVVEQIDGEYISLPKAIIEGLQASNRSGSISEYAFGVTALDAGDNWTPDPSTFKPDDLNRGRTLATNEKLRIPIPLNPIVLVPGVGSKLGDQKHFDTLKQYFSELGWSSAPEASVSYVNSVVCAPYVKGTMPLDVTWAANTPDVKKYNVFTFVPFVPDWINPIDNKPAHEIGIEQKGIELGYFLNELNNQGAGNFQLIGHSLGGLTCRAYIQRIKAPSSYSNNVVRIVTMGTPNNGVMEDNANYPQYKGVKDILLNGYTQDSRRFSIFRSHGWKDTETKDYFTALIDFLENEQWGQGGGWDFSGKTLLEDVLYHSEFMTDLSGTGGTFGTLPNLQYASILGEMSVFKQQDNMPWPWQWAGGVNGDLWYPAGNNSFLGYGDLSGNGGDGIVSTKSQNLNTVFANSARVINRNKNHMDEENDCSGILMGLGYPVLTIQANCPVDLKVTAPSGQYMAKGDSAMFLATYREIENGNSPTPHKLVEIPFPEVGQYKIDVIPDMNAGPDATYSLIVSRGDVTTVLADNVKISEIPQTPYQLTGNTAPIANAGADQVVYAWIDGKASVTLNGAGSSDADGDTLTYKWTWTVDSTPYEANGVNPTITLPVGVHKISLVVNDKLVDSVPDDMNVTVVAPLKAKAMITPCVINRKDNDKDDKDKDKRDKDKCDKDKDDKDSSILGYIELPYGVKKADIDASQMLVLEPGDITAKKQWMLGCGNWWKPQFGIFGFFDENALLKAIPTNGQKELTIVGKLKSGRYFYGTDKVVIIEPKKHGW